MEFIRFVPYNVDFQDTWQTAFNSWRHNLSTLLNMNDNTFIRSTNTLPSLVDFIHQVWDAHLDGERVDRILLQHIFFLYVRLSRLPDTSDHKLFQADLLVKLAVVYSSTNKLQLREIMQDFAEKISPIFHSLVESIGLIPQTNLDRNALERAYVLVRTFDALVSATLPSFLPIDILIAEWYNSFTPCLKKAVDNDSSVSSYAYMIKKLLVSVFQSYADLKFFQPLGYVVDDTGDLVVSGQLTNHQKATEFLGEWIEQSEIRPSSVFVDAPIIMDWESVYNISEKIGQMNQALFSGKDDVMLILQLQMEQVKDTINQLEDWRPEEDDREQKVAQVREVLGNFSEDTIEAYLDKNNDDVEVVIMKLLQESTQVLSNRKNIYDNDEFDVFSHNTVDTSKVYAGKKDKGDADNLLDDKSFIDKDSTLQRVMDMYEDEYDDGYDDINDASGVPEVEQEGAQDIVKQKVVHVDPSIQHESLLVHLFMETPDILSRNSTARRSSKREELKRQTGMTDEQLEGWAIMFGKNPRKQRILDRYMLFDGNQVELPKKPSVPQTQQASQSQSSKKSETKDRSFKDKNKARFGNHNRKNMRDKKLNKAGPPPS